MVDDLEHLWPRAVVLRQGEHAAGLLAPLAEDLDVGVAEAVDRLELVADEEQLLAGEQVDQFALEAVRVLELVDHDRAQPPALAVADLGVPDEEVARVQLEVLEVERRVVVLGRPVGLREGLQQTLEEVAVPAGELVERSPLDTAARLFVGRVPLPRAAFHGVAGEVEEGFRDRRRVEQLEDAGERVVRPLVQQAACRVAQLLHARRELGARPAARARAAGRRNGASRTRR